MSENEMSTDVDTSPSQDDELESGTPTEQEPSESTRESATTDNGATASSEPVEVLEAADQDPSEAAAAEPASETASEPATGSSEPAAAAVEASGDGQIDAEASDEEEDEDEEPNYFFIAGDWYVVHTYAGYENKVKANLASRIQSMNMEDKIYDVVVPTEEVMELKSGKMQAVQKKVFPGYILVRMELDDDSWYVVRNTPGVTGFVGSGAKPTPLDTAEVTKILAPKSEDRPKPKLEYEVGEVVSVIGGAFNGYSGPVNAIDVDKQRVTV